jgi:membrane protease YdiL (CAAX protease family)
MDAEALRNGQGETARRQAVRAGLSAVLLWVGIEFGLRTVGLVTGALAIASMTGVEDPAPAHVGALNNGLLVAAVLALWVAFDRRIRREGIGLPDLGYRFTRGAGVIGMACGVGLLGIAAGTASLDVHLFRFNVDEHLATIAATPMLGILALFVGNALLAPVVEELAWRGYIQGRLALGWGPRAAPVATALLFAAKHTIVDLSLGRSVTLVIGSLALGVIRDRWGTFESTLAHFTLNFTATTLVVHMALTR